MEVLNEILPIVLYLLGAALLFVVIMLVVKLTYTIDKVNVLLDDIEAKSKTLDGLFSAIDSVSNTISSANMKLVEAVSSVIGKLMSKRKKKKLKEEIDENE